MFILLLFALIGAGYLHGRFGGEKTQQGRYELILVYLTAGYCGVIMVGVSVWGMISPPSAAGMVGTEPGNPFQEFFLVAYLGMSVMATLSIWIRGSYLTANVVNWSIYWFGATYLHLADYHDAGKLDFYTGAQIVGAHALAPIFMILFLALAYRNAKSPM